MFTFKGKVLLLSSVCVALMLTSGLHAQRQPDKPQSKSPGRSVKPRPDPKAQPPAKVQPNATDRLIAHAAALALAASAPNAAPLTHDNMVAVGFPHRPSDFFGAGNVGPGKITYRIVWNESTAIIGFQGRSQSVHDDLFWDSREHKKGLSKILGKSGFMIYVPKRFYEAFEAARPTIEKDLQSALASGRDTGRGSSKKLIITGHSMGGLWSHYLTMALLEKGQPVEAMVTFGTPYLARPDFQRYVEGLAKEKGTRMLAVENHFDHGINNWMEKVSAGIHHTPKEYQNRIGTQVRYAFREEEHHMTKFFHVAKFRSYATPAPELVLLVDGTRATISPKVENTQLDKVQIQLYPLKDSGAWWKAIKVVDINGKGHWLEWENGKFVNPPNKNQPGQLWLSRSALEDTLRLEFWKAKELGIHRPVFSHDVNLVTQGKNRIAIWW